MPHPELSKDSTSHWLPCGSAVRSSATKSMCVMPSGCGTHVEGSQSPICLLCVSAVWDRDDLATVTSERTDPGSRRLHHHLSPKKEAETWSWSC